MKAEQMAFQLNEATKYRAPSTTTLSGKALLHASHLTWNRLFYSVQHPDLKSTNGLSVQLLRKLLSDYFLKQHFAIRGFAPDIVLPGYTDGYSDDLDVRIIDIAQSWVAESQKNCGAIEAETGDSFFHMNKKIFCKFSTVSDLNECFSIKFTSSEEVNVTYHRVGDTPFTYTGLKVLQTTIKDETDPTVDRLNEVFKTRLSFEKPMQEKDADQNFLDTRPNVKFSQPIKLKLDPENYVIVENRKSAPTLFDCAAQWKTLTYKEADDSSVSMSLFCAIWGMEPQDIVTPEGNTKIKDCYGKDKTGWTYSTSGGGWKKKEELWQFAGFSLASHPFRWSRQKDQASVELLLKCLVHAPSDDPDLYAGRYFKAQYSSLWSFYVSEESLFEVGSNVSYAYWVLDQIKSTDKNEMLNLMRSPGDSQLSRAYCSLIRAYRKSTEGMDRCAINDAATNQSMPSVIVASSGISPAAHAYDAQQKIEEARSKLNNYKYFKLSFVTEHVGLAPYTKELELAFKEEIKKSLKLNDEMAKNVIVEIEE